MVEWAPLVSAFPVGKAGDLFMFKTKHLAFNMDVIFIDELRLMHNGWTNTDHILPGFTNWDGYKHVFPKDVTWTKYYGTGKRGDVIGFENVGLTSCPFCGKQPTWYSSDGFVGSRVFQERKIALKCCVVSINHYNPSACAEIWNRRAYTDK